MKKVLMMIGELVLLMGIFLGVSIIHNDVIVPKSGAYGDYLKSNLPIWIMIMFAITSVIIAFYFQMKKLVVKDRYVSIVKMSHFSKISKIDTTLSILVGIFTGLIFITLINVSFMASSFPELQDYVNMFMKSDTFIMIFIGLCVIGPLFEEVLFRGLLFNTMRRGMPFLVALLLQAVLYGFSQPNSSIQIMAFFLAIIYGLMYYRLKSIWSTILIAAVMNSVIFVTKKVGFHDYLADGVPNHILLFIAGICLFFVIVILVSVWKNVAKVQDLKMIGNLFLWSVVYLAVYYPFLIIWNNHIMKIDSISPWLGDNNVFGFVFYDIIAFAIYFYVMKFVHKKNLIVVSNFSRISYKNAFMITILGISMGVWVQCFFAIPYFKTNVPQFDQLTRYLTTAILPVFILFLIIHSIYKEIFFRAMIYNVMRSTLPMSVSIAMTGIIYGGLFFNWDPVLTIYASVGALIFSLMFEWFKSIMAPIINEFFVFAAYYVIYKLNISYGIGVVLALIVTSILILSLTYFLWKNRESQAEEIEHAYTPDLQRIERVG